MTEQEKATLSRRGFLKAAALAGTAAALSGCAPTQSEGDSPALSETGEEFTEDDVKYVKTLCRGCITECGVIATVKNGRVVRLEKNPEEPRSGVGLCPKGLSGLQALYHPNRGKYPMKRVGERGSNQWERISWTEAIDTIATKLEEMREQYGPDALIYTTGGGGHPQFYTPMRFENAFGGGTSFEPGAAQCYVPRISTFWLMDGMNADTSIADGNCHELYFEDSPVKSYVMWGTCPAWHGPSLQGKQVAKLRERGVKTVVVDPRFTPDAARADVWLPVRAGTDPALLMSWLRYIIDSKLYDEEFVTQWTNAPLLVNPETKVLIRQSDLEEGGDEKTFMVWDTNTNSVKPLGLAFDESLAPALLGTYEVNGMQCSTGLQVLWEAVEEFTLEKAAEICWLDADKIEEAIKIYADGPGGLSIGVATDQHPSSSVCAMAACQLNVIMGYVGKPGCLLQSFGMTPNGEALPFYGLRTEESVRKAFGTSTEYKGLGLNMHAHIPSTLAAIETGEPYQPHIWMEGSGNKLALLANPERWRDAARKMDLVVHLYMYPTAFTAECADIFLPTFEWLESYMLQGSLNYTFVRQPATHLFETIDGKYIPSMIIKKCAELGNPTAQIAIEGTDECLGGDRYWKDFDDYLAWMGECVGLDKAGFDEILEKGYREFMPEEEYRQYEVFKQINRETGLPNGVDTSTGKLELYAESLITLGRTGAPWSLPVILEPASEDYPPVPYYIEPDESPLTDTEYPFVMSNGRLPMYHHATLRNIPYLREAYPVPEVWINADSAADLGIADGDWVHVSSRRATITSRAMLTQAINPREVYMERFWNPEFLENGEDISQSWKAMNVNMLSNGDSRYDRVYGSYTLRGYTVKIEKTDAPPKGVWYEPEDFEPWMPQPSDETEMVFA